jgi:hypothetical protein
MDSPESNPYARRAGGVAWATHEDNVHPTTVPVCGEDYSLGSLPPMCGVACLLFPFHGLYWAGDSYLSAGAPTPRHSPEHRNPKPFVHLLLLCAAKETMTSN